MDEFKENMSVSWKYRTFIYVISFLICVIVGTAISMFLLNDITQIKIGQGISSAFIFIVPPIILFVVTRQRPMYYLGFRKPNPVWMLLIGVLLMFVSLPLTNLLTSWNEKMNMGAFFSALQDIMRELEDTASDLTERMLQVDTIGGLLLNLLVIALIPAIGEELTFRGVLQQVLTKRFNVHVAVFLSAFIFSFIHFQFFGLLPRMFLGLLLGYLFYYSGSIWTNILMHFVNNGAAVVVSYLQYKNHIDVDVDNFGATDSVWVLLASLIVTVGLIVLSAKINKKYGRQ